MSKEGSYMKFDVNKIIAESIAEADPGGFQKVTAARKGINKAKDAVQKVVTPEADAETGPRSEKAFEASKELAKARENKLLDPAGHARALAKHKDAMRTPDEKFKAAAVASKANEAKRLEKVADVDKTDREDVAKSVKAAEHEKVASVDKTDQADVTNAVKSSEHAKAAEHAKIADIDKVDQADIAKSAKSAEHEASVAGHLGRSLKKFKEHTEEHAAKIGHKVAGVVGNLEPGHVAAAGAIAAGLGALALRRRLKKVKK
jgi:hypothetical protein